MFLIDKPLALRYTFVSATAKLVDGRLDVVSVNELFIFFNGNNHLHVGGSWPVSLM